MDIYCWITILVTSVIVLNHYVSCVQEFHLQPQNKSATQGSTIILKCVIKNKGNGNVQWTRGDFALGIDRSMPEYDRYSMIGTRNNLGGDYIEEFSLKITDLRLEDDDKYRCIVMFTDEHKGILSDYAYVSVLIPPSQPILPGGQTIPVILDKATNISCQALNGKPKAQITWKKDGLRVTEKTFEFGTTQPDGKRVDTTGIVTITASLTDAGKKIECGAWNEALERDDVYWTQATLDVQYAPKIRLTHNNPDRTMREYDDIKFVCTGKANPFESVYKWYRNDELIADENKSIYVIPRIPRDYHGDKIKCEATNSVGTTVTEHSMNILYGPKFKNKEANHISVDRGQRAELRCEADGNPTAGITWRRQGKFPILHSSSTYVIPSVREGMFGVYTCTATVLGFVEISRDVYLTENGPPEIMSDKKQYSDVGETARIQCMTVSSPKPVFIWTRNGEPIDYATSGRFSAPEEGLPYGGKSVLQIMNIQEEDFGQYNCTVYNGKGSDTLVITLQQKEELPTSIIIGGAVGGVAVILIIVIACFAYYRCRHSDNESYAETDSNTEIKKRDKNESPSELTKSTLMDQWRQDYNYRYSADFDEPDGKGNNNGVCGSPGEERYGTMPTMQHNNYGGAPTYEPYASDDINVGTGNRYESSYSTGYIPSTFRSPSRTDYNTGRVPANDFTSGRASALDFTNGRTSAVDFPSGRASAVDFNSRIPNSDFTNGRVSAIDFTGRNSTEPNSEPFRLPAADYSTTKLATNV